MAYEIMIQSGSTICYPVVKEGVKLSWERKGVPGRLEFQVVDDEALSFAEGNPVKLSVDGTDLFYGFIFKHSSSKDGIISITCYDQLRYLKNKDTYTEEGLKASDLVKRIATDFNLNLGTVEDTGYKIEAIVEENQTLFDMIQNALQETLLNTGKLYVLYDDVGKLTLKNINSMKVGLLIDQDTAEDYAYESSIDDQTYDKIKLTYNNEKTGKRDVYVAQNGSHMNDWGTLQYYEALQTATGAQAKAKQLLSLYDQVARRLTIKDAIGDVRVRAGSAVMVDLSLGDVSINQLMVVERVDHTFRENEHRMTMDLIGGEFIA